MNFCGTMLSDYKTCPSLLFAASCTGKIDLLHFCVHEYRNCLNKKHVNWRASVHKEEKFCGGFFVLFCFLHYNTAGEWMKKSSSAWLVQNTSICSAWWWGALQCVFCQRQCMSVTVSNYLAEKTNLILKIIVDWYLTLHPLNKATYHIHFRWKHILSQTDWNL